MGIWSWCEFGFDPWLFFHATVEMQSGRHGLTFSWKWRGQLSPWLIENTAFFYEWLTDSRRSSALIHWIEWNLKKKKLFELLFWNNYRLTGNCKNSTMRSCVPFPQFPPVMVMSFRTVEQDFSALAALTFGGQLCVGGGEAVLCAAGCLAASLALTHQMLIASSP